MPSDQVTRIAGESEENRALREQLNKKLHILTKGLETCKRFIGIRTFGKRESFSGILHLLTELVETSDMRAQTQNKLPAYSVNTQDAPKHFEKPQDDEVGTVPSQTSPVEPQDDGFESVTRLSQSDLSQNEDNKDGDPEQISEFEGPKEPDVAPTWASSRKYKKGKKKQSRTYAN